MMYVKRVLEPTAVTNSHLIVKTMLYFYFTVLIAVIYSSLAKNQTPKSTQYVFSILYFAFVFSYGNQVYRD
jgi:hypothetical protein